MKKWLGK